MYVHELRFVDTAELQRCFAELMKHASVEDCTVEPEALRIRFCSPPRRAAQILERVYLFGGLTWCTRHRIRDRS